MLPGALAAGLWLGWRAVRAPVLRQPLALSSAVGLVVWVAGGFGLGLNQQRDVPDVPLQSLSAAAEPQQARLAELARGRPTVIALWASWCGVCHQQMPHWAAAQQRQPDVQVLFINQGEDAARAQAYLQQQGLGVRQVWLDAASRTGPAVGSLGLPTTLFYNAQGQLVHRQVGLISPPALASRLRDLTPP
ncbi:MAG: TlpA disulfide reductase family protein [Ideonella sp.]|nr:TlpA disulfide reductase family protein [Ideonella sp.]